MLGLAFDFELADGDPGGSGVEPTVGEQFVSSITEWWATRVATPYEELPANRRLDPMIVEWTFQETPATFEVRFGFSLLEDLAQAYAAFGWAAIEGVERRVGRLPALYEPSKRFLAITRNVIAVFVAQGLVELEQEALIYADRRWEDATKQLLGYQEAFRDIGVAAEDWRFIDEQLERDLVDLCRQYGLLLQEAQKLQIQLESRRRKSPPGQREEGSGWQMWFELYAAPQREILEQLTALLKQIGPRFPATVLVLDSLPESLLLEQTVYNRARAGIDLSHAVRGRVHRILGELTEMKVSLSDPPATAALAARIEPFLASSPNLSSLPAMEWAEGGPEKVAIDVVFSRTGADDQRVLADLELLSALYDYQERPTPGAWMQIAHYRYLVALAAEVEERRKTQAKWAAFWNGLKRLVALLGLLALMAFFPFGDAATLPALATALSWFATGAAVLGLIVFVVHDMLLTLAAAGRIEAEARDHFFRLAQTDPQALAEIGDLMSRSSALRSSVYEGGVMFLLTIGAAKLKAVTAALDLQGFIGDVQTLFEPEPEPEPSEGAP